MTTEKQIAISLGVGIALLIVGNYYFQKKYGAALTNVGAAAGTFNAVSDTFEHPITSIENFFSGLWGEIHGNGNNSTT